MTCGRLAPVECSLAVLPVGGLACLDSGLDAPVDSRARRALGEPPTRSRLAPAEGS